METIHLSDKGTHLTLRFDAMSIRRKVVNCLLDNKKVVLDFSGVQTVSPSFADECYGKLSFDFSGPEIVSNVEVKHANPFIFDAIVSAFKERLLTAQYAY